ncbi:MAG: SEL1-like repeat protein [Bacteroidales bacterium]|nr:SEL1-like repeat protein [Bacteroidales bacterium]
MATLNFDDIDDELQIAMGKSNLQFKEIDEAFDNLFLSACRNDEAYEYFQVIPNTDTRLFRLTEEQLETARVMAEKGYSTAQYVLGRYHQVVQPDDDSIEKAAELLKAAAEEMDDATAALAVMHLYGHFGEVNLDFYREKIDEAVQNGSGLAMQIKLHNMTEGLHGEKQNPKKVIEFLENDILDDEDLAEKYPYLYVILGDAYRKMGKKDKAVELYEQAKELGFFEADYNICVANMEGMAQMQKSIYESVVDFGCDDKVPGCFLLKAEINEDEYEECEDEDKLETISQTIKEALEQGFELGATEAAFKLGCNYYYGNYGFEEDNSEAWDWFVKGVQKDNGASYAGLATMAKDGICPDNLPENFIENCLFNAKNRGFDVDGSEDEDISQMQCLAIVKANGDATIYKFNKDDFAQLAGFIGAKRLTPIRVDALNAIAKKAGITDYLQAWIDYEAPRKQLPVNVAAKSFFKGVIAGDIIITLGDKNYDPMMFYGTDDLETVLKAMKVKNIEVVTDDLDLEEAQLPKDNLKFDPKPTGFVARIQPDGTAHIVKSSVGVFAMFETDIYDPMRLDALVATGEKIGLKGRLTIWTDNSSLRKQMIMNNRFDLNAVGTKILKGPVADNFFVAMEDKNYDIMLFDDVADAEKAVVALGVKPENVIVDQD